MGPPSPPPTHTSHSPCPEMQLPLGKQVGSAAGESGKPLVCVCGRGVEQGAGKDPGLRSYFKATESNGTEAWSMMTKEDVA